MTFDNVTPPREFKNHVRIEARLKNPSIPQEFMDAISDIFIRRDHTRPEHIGLAADLVHHFYHQSKKDRAIQNQSLVETQLPIRPGAPGTLLDDLDIEIALRPRVEAIRRDYFGEPRAPFRYYWMAAKWLREHETILQNMSTVSFAHLSNEAQRVIDQFPDTYEVEWQYGPRSIPLLASGPGAMRGRVLVGKGSSLIKLRKLAKDMSEVTGCDEALCIAHILVGAPLVTTPVTYSTETIHGLGLIKQSGIIHILRPHVATLEMLKQPYMEIRKDLRISKRKAAKGWHLELINLVEKHGGVPTREKTVFWKEIQLRWNRVVRKGGRRFTTWMGPKMAYDRIKSSLPSYRALNSGQHQDRAGKSGSKIDYKQVQADIKQLRKEILKLGSKIKSFSECSAYTHSNHRRPPQKLDYRDLEI